jgi:predicted unusual protein kinase regulating ubiquinone biosynthesis (AarF/ABC1/UbiB family)
MNYYQRVALVRSRFHSSGASSAAARGWGAAAATTTMVVTVVVGYGFYRESTVTSTLPLSYDWPAIRTYWSDRPVATVARLGAICYHLSPIAMRYLLLPNNKNHDNRTSGRSSPSENKTTTTGDDDDELRALAIAVRGALTQLGPAFIKIGQQLSIRPDLLPAVVLKELQQLCDQVEPMDDDLALSLICAELNLASLDELFTNTPVRVAAASLGQVYRATLRNNNSDHDHNGRRASKRETTPTDVAIKVQRPDTLQTFSLDLYLLQRLSILMDVFTTAFTQQPPFHQDLYESFAAGSYAELDYINEAANQREFRDDLVLHCAQLPVRIPTVLSEYSTRTVLTTQWVDGTKLSDIADRALLRKLIPVGVELFLTQLLDTGHFHGDPHPGNLLVTPDGKLCLLDFGWCCRIGHDERQGLTTAVYHLLTQNFDELVERDAKTLGFLPADLDVTELKPLLVQILTAGMGTSDLRQRQRQLVEISNELNQVFFQYPFTVPPYFALVTRGLGLLEGYVFFLLPCVCVCSGCFG